MKKLLLKHNIKIKLIVFSFFEENIPPRPQTPKITINKKKELLYQTLGQLRTLMNPLLIFEL